MCVLTGESWEDSRIPVITEVPQAYPSSQPKCVRSGRRHLQPLVTPVYTCVCYKKTTLGSPRPPRRQCPTPPNPVLCLNLCSGSSGSQGPSRFGVGSAVTCWAISTELLGPRRSSFSGEGKARKVETSAGGGEDRTGAGSWGTGGTGGSVEVQIQTPYPEHTPLMQASQGSESRIPQSPPRVGCPQMLALVSSSCRSLWGRGKPPPSDSKSLVQPSGSSP